MYQPGAQECLSGLSSQACRTPGTGMFGRRASLTDARGALTGRPSRLRARPEKSKEETVFAFRTTHLLSVQRPATGTRLARIQRQHARGTPAPDRPVFCLFLCLF